MNFQLVKSLTGEMMMKLCRKSVNRLMEAIMNRDCNELLSAIDYGANVNACIDRNFYTPLHYAVLTNFREGTELLLKYGADVNAHAAKHLQHMTPFEQAKLFQFEEIVDLFVTGKF